MVHSEIAVLRFGLGARPGELGRVAGDPRGWLRSQMRGLVPLSRAVGATPLARSDEIFAGLAALRRERREAHRGAPQSDSDIKASIISLRAAYVPHYQAQVLARGQSATLTTRPFAERLVHFWANHFAVSADKGAIFGLAGTLENEAIRPHVNAHFSELLIAVEQHPAMIAFLDNQYSAGAESVAAQMTARRTNDETAGKRQFGINENLAREILELHTLGVNGGYTQRDVTTFAQIITGWSIGGGKNPFSGGETGRFLFRENLHEPGGKVFLGKLYPEDGQAQGQAVLEDLARNPATARFIATKLARHFISDDPPPRAVERITRAFLKSDGNLPDVYGALIDCSEAWDPRPTKFKTPEDFVFSSLRALDKSPERPQELLHAFEFLGQRQYTPGSPAGWPDTAKGWDGSDALMRRVLWASQFATRYDDGIDPADVATSALGGYARDETLSAVRRAASGTQGLALLLMSPEFQRR